MNTILWISQAILAAAFLYSGLCKSIYSQQQLIAKGQTGVAGLPAALIRFIGISEVLGAAGILLPWGTGILPVLTPITAICFAGVMLLAAPIHYRLKEPRNVATNIFLLVLAVLVAWGRWNG
ncbi:MAG TPA: DoxX family protein [Chitinophagaceae bacterium]|nr:DoxX family protein [Chitinophagaceae bacterium]